MGIRPLLDRHSQIISLLAAWTASIRASLGDRSSHRSSVCPSAPICCRQPEPLLEPSAAPRKVARPSRNTARDLESITLRTRGSRDLGFARRIDDMRVGKFLEFAICRLPFGRTPKRLRSGPLACVACPFRGTNEKSSKKVKFVWLLGNLALWRASTADSASLREGSGPTRSWCGSHRPSNVHSRVGNHR